MPLSLKSQLRKLAHKGQITKEEYSDLINKLEGHDHEIREEAYKKGYDDGWYDCGKTILSVIQGE